MGKRKKCGITDYFNIRFIVIRLIRYPTGKRTLGRPRRTWEDNIRMDLKEVGINAGNWVVSAQDTDYWRALAKAALEGVKNCQNHPYVINE